MSRRLAIMGFLQGLTASKSVRKPRTFGVHNVKADAQMTFSMQGDGSLSNDGRKSEKELPALAAQLRAFRKVFSSSSSSSVRRKAFPESKVSAKADEF